MNQRLLPRTTPSEETAESSRRNKIIPEVTPQLLRAVKEGDNDAFESLYLTCFAPLVSFLDILTHDTEESRKIAQNIFVRIYENRSRLDPSNNFKGYLLKSAKMEFFQLLKKKKVKEKFMSHTFHTADVFELAPDEVLIGREMALFMQIYIENMPPQRQKIFRMSRIQGMTLGEIADELGLSRNTVRNQLQTAKNGLRELLSLFVILFIS